MRVTVEYFAQLRAAAGCDAEEITCDDDATVDDVIVAACAAHAELASLVVDGDGARHPWILVSMDGAVIEAGATPPVSDGTILVLSSPISGG